MVRDEHEVGLRKLTWLLVLLLASLSLGSLAAIGFSAVATINGHRV